MNTGSAHSVIWPKTWTTFILEYGMPDQFNGFGTSENISLHIMRCFLIFESLSLSLSTHQSFFLFFFGDLLLRLLIAMLSIHLSSYRFSMCQISPEGVTARDEKVFRFAKERNTPLIMLTSGETRLYSLAWNLFTCCIPYVNWSKLWYQVAIWSRVLES